MITLTESAITRIKDLIIDEGNPALKLRVFVEGGGCSGMSYVMDMIPPDQITDDDHIEIYNNIRLYSVFSFLNN
jgi:iron-sulfur cluster insertion protein